MINSNSKDAVKDLIFRLGHATQEWLHHAPNGLENVDESLRSAYVVKALCSIITTMANESILVHDWADIKE
jgi:hypothetical protein